MMLDGVRNMKQMLEDESLIRDIPGKWIQMLDECLKNATTLRYAVISNNYELALQMIDNGQTEQSNAREVLLELNKQIRAAYPEETQNFFTIEYEWLAEIRNTFRLEQIPYLIRYKDIPGADRETPAAELNINTNTHTRDYGPIWNFLYYPHVDTMNDCIVYNPYWFKNSY